MANRSKKAPAAPAPTPVPITPAPLRAGAALLFGCGVGILAAPLDRTVHAIALVICLGAGLLWIFSHPYRRDIRAAVESRGGKYTTRVSQLFPLLPLWLALMVVPGIALNNWFASLGVAAIAATYSWLVIPFIDGTRAAAKL